MKKQLTLILALLFGFYFQGNSQYSRHLNDTLLEAFQSISKQMNYKGISAAVHFSDGSVWESSYGHFGTEELHSELLYECGSNTKTMIAALVLMLEEEGKLSIDDTLYHYLSPIKNVSYGISIKQLLNHTSGLANFTEHPNYFAFINQNWNTFVDVDQMLRDYLAAPLDTPGSTWRYCNTNYTLLGLLIEEVEGKDLAKCLREKIFDPLELNDTYLSFYENVRGTHLGTWISGSYNEDVPVSFMSSAWAAGGVICAPRDLAKWSYLLYSGQVLKDASYQKMIQTIPSDPGEEYGLGVIKRNYAGSDFYGHGGQTLQTSTMEYSMNNDYSLVLMGIEDGKWGATMNIQKRLKHVLESQLPTIDITNIPELQNDDAYSIYPNPSADNLYIANAAIGDFKVRLINAQGKLVFEQTTNSGIMSIQSQDCGMGMFWLQIEGEDGHISSKKVIFE